MDHTEVTASSHANTEHQLAWRIVCYVENWQIYVSADVSSSQISEFAALHAGRENVHHCHSPAVDPHSTDFLMSVSSEPESVCLFII